MYGKPHPGTHQNTIPLGWQKGEKASQEWRKTKIFEIKAKKLFITDSL